MMQQIYVLQGYGTIDPNWVQSCLHLFKDGQVNLRKVVLLKNQDPVRFSMLEIHFALPKTPSEPTQDERLNHPFIAQLQAALAQQVWQHHSLRVNPN